jgi:hypothetical protein
MQQAALFRRERQFAGTYLKVAQITQRNAAWLYYFAEKDSLEFEWFWGFVCDYQRDLREIHGVSRKKLQESDP